MPEMHYFKGPGGSYTLVIRFEEPTSPVEHIVHIMGRGAEAPPVADEARRKRGELRSETAVPRRTHDYSEPDRTSEAQ